jgi:hypothetical protein
MRSCIARQKTTEMASEHTIMLLDIAGRVAQKLRTDPRIANFLDPAVCIAAYDDGCDAMLIERPEAMQIMSEIRTNEAELIHVLPERREVVGARRLWRSPR